PRLERRTDQRARTRQLQAVLEVHLGGRLLAGDAALQRALARELHAEARQRLAVVDGVDLGDRERLGNREVTLDERPQRAVREQRVERPHQLVHIARAARERLAPARRAQVEIAVDVGDEARLLVEEEFELEQV